MSDSDPGGSEAEISPREGEVVVADTELQAGALGLMGVMIQAVTHIAPGLNILLGLAFIVSFAGLTAPIAYLIGGVICLGVAIVLTQLAKHITSAGGYFTYVSRTVGARAGWLTTWIYFLYDPVAVGAVCAFTAALLRDTLNSQYGWSINWYLIFIVLVVIVTAFTMFGVALSAKAMLFLGGLEVVGLPRACHLGPALTGRRWRQLLVVQPGQHSERQRPLPGRCVHDPGVVRLRIGGSDG